MDSHSHKEAKVTEGKDSPPHFKSCMWLPEEPIVAWQSQLPGWPESLFPKQRRDLSLCIRRHQSGLWNLSVLKRYRARLSTGVNRHNATAVSGAVQIDISGGSGLQYVNRSRSSVNYHCTVFLSSHGQLPVLELWVGSVSQPPAPLPRYVRFVIPHRKVTLTHPEAGMQSGQFRHTGSWPRPELPMATK